MLNLLKNYGYDSIRLPKEGINPFAILRKGAGVVDRMGNLANTLAESSPEKLPALEVVATADINGKSFLQTDFHAGIELLKNLLANLGAQAPAGLDIVFKHARTLSFAATNTVCCRVDLLTLQSFLNHGRNKENVQQLVSDNGTVYLITEILKTNAFSVEAHGENSQKLSLNIPEIKGIVKGDIGISHADNTDDNVEIKGTSKLTYAYKAVRIDNNKGSILKFWEKPELHFSLVPVTGLQLNE